MIHREKKVLLLFCLCPALYCAQQAVDVMERGMSRQAAEAIEGKGRRPAYSPRQINEKYRVITPTQIMTRNETELAGFMKEQRDLGAQKTYTPGTGRSKKAYNESLSEIISAQQELNDRLRQWQAGQLKDLSGISVLQERISSLKQRLDGSRADWNNMRVNEYEPGIIIPLRAPLQLTNLSVLRKNLANLRSKRAALEKERDALPITYARDYNRLNKSDNDWGKAISTSENLDRELATLIARQNILEQLKKVENPTQDMLNDIRNMEEIVSNQQQKMNKAQEAYQYRLADLDIYGPAIIIPQAQ